VPSPPQEPVPPAVNGASGEPPLAAPAITATTSSPPPFTIVDPPAVVIPTHDAHPAASDHDAVVRRWGLGAGRMGSFPLRPGRGCPSTVMSASCSVDLGTVTIRHWMTRNFALDAGLTLGVGGGSEESRALDTYVGFGPMAGMTVLLGNWKHLAVGASPEFSVVYFRPGGSSAQSTLLVDLRAELEGELHLGFIGVPALSVGLATGFAFRYQGMPGVDLWSIGATPPQTLWGTLSNLFIRYYL
jgi:hypothetical protein